MHVYLQSPALRLPSICGALAMLLLGDAPLSAPRRSFAQEPAPQAAPQDLGLTVPDAPHKQGGDRRVLVKSPDNKLVVGNVLVEVGDHFVVILPNGRLTSVPQQEATVTDRKFEPAKMKEIAEELTSSTFAGFKTRETKRYLYVYNTSEPFFKGASRILETMYPALYAYCRRQKIKVHDPETPLVMIMFRTQAEFDKYRQMPEGVVAYYNGVTNHVVMYEQSELLEIAPDLAFKQAISTIAHEGVHQVLHNIGVQQRLSNWPMWISEGLPEYFAPTSIDKNVRWKGVGFPNDLRMKELDEYLKQDKLIELAKPTSEAKALTSTDYAIAWALTHTLATNRKDKFFAFLNEVSRRGPLDESSPEDDAKLFAKHFGKDFADLDKQIIKNLQKLPYVDPVLNQTHYVALLQAPLGAVTHRSYMVTTSPRSIKEWQEKAISELPGAARATAQVTIQAFPNRAAARVFAEAWLAN
ncbi:MAG TPA: DUF1570 domain-containing protein [Pirellulales bacterium]|nr:DUF1570 domain-containing protein [Pirellulales bacterium]